MASEPAESRARQTPTPGPAGHSTVAVEGRRGWFSHGLAALAISALGLALAGSISLTTSAQPVAAPAPVAVQADQPLDSGAEGPNGTTVPGAVPKVEQNETVATDQSLATFTRAQVVEDTSRSVQVRAAVVKERAAQRAEELAKSAEVLTQAARDAGGVARSQELATSQRATREAAVKIAQQRLAEAIRKRVAAETERQGVERAASEPSTSSSAPASTAADSSTSVPSGGGSASPVPNAVIGAHFGQYGSWSRYHTGLDFRAGFGTPIKAVADGAVVFAGNSGDWAGNHVAVRHSSGMTTMSSHMSSMTVNAGQSVKAGQVIGYVGSTGRSFGPHLHFELYPAGVKHGDVYRAVNPVPWLRDIGVSVN